jgi:hypothetical protein
MKRKGNVMKSAVALCLVLFTSVFHEAKAQKTALPPVDFSAMTCDQFWEKTTAAIAARFYFG